MVDRIIEEIDICLKNNCYMAALSMALILPDICGKVEYPKLKTAERYKNWYEEYIGQYERNSDADKEMSYLSKELVYSLRCSILHTGNPSIDKEKLEIPHFGLLWFQHANNHILMDCSGIMTEKIGDMTVVSDKQYSLDIRRICFILTNVAKKYYKENKDKFSFFNYEIHNIDERTRKVFGIIEDKL